MLKKTIIVLATLFSFNQSHTSWTKKEKALEIALIKTTSSINFIEKLQKGALIIAANEEEIVMEKVIKALFDLEEANKALSYIQKKIKRASSLYRKQEKYTKNIYHENQLLKKKQKIYELEKTYKSLLNNNKRLMSFFEYSERFKYAYNIFKNKKKLYSSIKSFFLTISVSILSLFIIPIITLNTISNNTFKGIFDLNNFKSTGNIALDITQFVTIFFVATAIATTCLAITIIPGVIITSIALFSIATSLVKTGYLFCITNWKQRNIIPASTNKKEDVFVITDSSFGVI